MAEYETIIIGAGMAGMTAAIYASRKRMNFLLISNDLGGQFSVSGTVENYPGFKTIDSSDLLSNIKEQLDYNNIELISESVSGIEKKDKSFIVKTDKTKYQTKTVIIASGARARRLEISGEEGFANKGLTYCAICDGPLFKDKEVAVIGGGNSALEAVEFLLRIAKKIYLVNIGGEVGGYEYLRERVLNNEKVEVINNAKTTEIFGDKFVKGLKYETNGEIKQLDCEGIFVEIGRIPNTDFVKDFVDLDHDNHIKISQHCETSVGGIYAAGDVTDIHEYQFIIAGGQGCTALLSASRKE